jgi:hypothetical protein
MNFYRTVFFTFYRYYDIVPWFVIFNSFYDINRTVKV